MAIKQEINNGVLWGGIDRPEALNAFDIPDLEELLQLFRDAKANPDVKVLVLTGTGRAFSVGADIKAMDKMTETEFGKAASLYQMLAREALALDKPIIGAINGFALGGGRGNSINVRHAHCRKIRQTGPARCLYGIQPNRRPDLVADKDGRAHRCHGYGAEYGYA